MGLIPMRAVFMGTPAFAVSTLERLVASGHEVVSVLTQPDRPAGRGRKLTPPPVKARALELSLEVFQPEKIRSPEAWEHLEAKAPEVIVVVGYGQIIPQRIIDLPKYGCVNVHSSLLPQYRGAAPMNWAIALGEEKTGVTTMRIVKKLDAGDILILRETPIGPDETASELSERLASMGADLLIETLARLDAGTITPVPQNDAESSYAPILKREDGAIDWSLPAQKIYNRLRGFDPWPGAYTTLEGKRLHLRRARLAETAGLAPGTMAYDGRLRIGCGGGTALEVLELQLEGKKRLPAADFARGQRLDAETVLGDSGPSGEDKK